MKNLTNQLKASVSSNALFTPVDTGVFIGPLNLKYKSAYEEYYRLNPLKEKEGFLKPIDEEVIDFIVDSFVFEKKEKLLAYKESLRNGFKQLNKKSLTARALIKTLFFKQAFCERENPKKTSVANIILGKDEIYFNYEVYQEITDVEAALSVLHETGHLGEIRQMASFFEPNKGYFKENYQPVTSDNFYIGRLNKVKQVLLCEAEKQAQEDQMAAEMLSFPTVAAKMFLLGLSEMIPFEKEAYPAFLKGFYKRFFNERQQVLMHHYVKHQLNRFSLFLKNPLHLFSRKKREKIYQKAVLKSVADRMNFLVSQKKPFLFKGLKVSSSFKRMLRGFFEFHLAYLMIACPFISVGLIGLYALGLGRVKIKKSSDSGKDGWKNYYDFDALVKGISLKSLRTGGKKKFNLFAKVLTHKYQNFISMDDIRRMHTENFRAEKEINAVKGMSRLTKDFQDDLSFLYCEVKAFEGDNFSYDGLKKLLYKANVFEKENKTMSFQNVVRQFVLKDLQESSICDEFIKKKAYKNKDFYCLKVKELRLAFNEKVERADFQTEKEKTENHLVLVQKNNQIARLTQLKNKCYER